MKTNGYRKEWVILDAAICFMLCIFAPIDSYYTNKDEFWFGIGQLLGVTIISFMIIFIIMLLISMLLSRMKSALYCYSLLLCLFIYFYVQGNFIPRNYGVLNGNDIDWDAYSSYGIASIVWALVCISIFVVATFKLKKNIFRIGVYLGSFIMMIQSVTILTLAIQDKISSTDKNYTSRVVTDENIFNLSENSNIIVFILDTFDGDDLNELLKKDNRKYEELFENFTYYPDTLGAYPTTKGALPQILTGIWYENECPYSEYIENAYEDNKIYEALKRKNYSIAMYTSEQFLSPDFSIYENVERGEYKISNVGDFAHKIYKLVAFNYMPHQLKRFFFLDTDSFLTLRKSSKDSQVYEPDVQEFEKKFNEKGIVISEVNNCFRLYHINGVHGPYTFGEQLISDPKLKYTSYDEAAGNCTLLKEFFDELKNKGVYDSATIVVMADHGHANYSQNPIFLIKNANEIHNFKISEAKMSYQYLYDIWVSLIEEKKVDEIYIENCEQAYGFRRFLTYTWDDSWDKEYLPEMYEAFAKGVAYDIDNIVFSGNQYQHDANDYSYTLGRLLSFTQRASANEYCILGFSENEGNGTWTDGKKAVMQFDLNDNNFNNLLLTIKADIFYTSQEAVIYVNDYKVADILFNGSEEKQVVIPHKYVSNGRVTLSIDLPGALSPQSVNDEWNDGRLLALCMESIMIDTTDEEFHLESQTDAYNMK